MQLDLGGTKSPQGMVITCRHINVQAGIVNGLSIAFQAWCVKKRGPVLVSMFSPVGTVCSVIVSGLTLGEPITIGRSVYSNSTYIKFPSACLVHGCPKIPTETSTHVEL